MENGKNLVLVQMDRATQRAMIWKDAVYETIMGYLVIACDSQNLPKTTKNVIMTAIEDMHVLEMHDYAKLSISIDQTFWNINKSLMRASAMSTAERASVAEQLKSANQAFLQKVRDCATMSDRILSLMKEGAEGDGKAETK